MASWQELEPQLLALLDLDSAARSARLAQLAAEQPEMASELSRLLDAAEQTRWDAQMAGGAALEVVQSLGAQLERDQDRTGARIGNYRLESLLGRGGMGAVYLAQRADGAYEQTAALKLLPGLSMNSGAGERFVRERQILARLEHPSIARLLDGGVTDDGNPYFVMEYVDGANLVDYCDSEGLEQRARLTLFAQLLAAVTFAHVNMVVHGDLKPDNVLVTAQGQLKLLDFGIARALDRSDEAADAVTALSPSYASPEQLRGEPATALSDLYALGLLLYRLLAGHLPRDFAGRSLAEIQQSLAQSADQTVVAAGALSGVGRDLRYIMQRALAPDPAHRYASIADFQADLQRLQADQPVHAHPPGRLYALGKFVARHRVGVGITVLTAGALIAALVAVSLSAQRAAESAARAERVAGFLQSLFDAANPFGAWSEEKSVADLLHYADQRYQQDLADDPLALAQMQDMLGVAFQGNGDYPRAVSLLRDALDTVATQYSPGSPEVALAHNHLAHALIDNGDYESAKVHAQQALERYLELGETHMLEQADAMTNLAVAVSNLGDRAESERLHTKALAIRQQWLSADDTRIADSQMSLAAAQAAQGNIANVLPLNQSAHAIYAKQYGSGHPMAVRAMNGVASGAFMARDYDSAATGFAELVALSEERLGRSHPELALPLNNLGRVQTETGDFVAAEAALARAVELTSGAQGKNMLAASALLNHGTVLAELGVLEPALERLDASADAFEALVGPGHPLLQRVQLRRVGILVLQGSYETAQSLLTTLEAQRGGEPVDAATAAVIALHRAKINNRLGRYDKSMTQLTPVLPVLSESMPANGWRRMDLELEHARARQEAPAVVLAAQRLSERLPAASVRRLQARALIKAQERNDASRGGAEHQGG